MDADPHAEGDPFWPGVGGQASLGFHRGSDGGRAIGECDEALFALRADEEAAESPPAIGKNALQGCDGPRIERRDTFSEGGRVLDIAEAEGDHPGWGMPSDHLRGKLGGHGVSSPAHWGRFQG